MTRSEVKNYLFALNSASKTVERAVSGIRRREDKLSTLPAAPVPAPLNVAKDVYAENDTVVVREGCCVVLPHGNQTSDPTAVAAIKRVKLREEIDSLTAEMGEANSYYLAMLQLMVKWLSIEDCRILHGYYCNPNRYTRESWIATYKVSQTTFYKSLRDAIYAMQQIPVDEFPAIPAGLKDGEQDE